MAFWRLGIFSGIIAGLIWAPVWHIIITVGLIVSSGISIELQFGPALLTGILVGGLTVIKKVENKLITLIIGSSSRSFAFSPLDTSLVSLLLSISYILYDLLRLVKLTINNFLCLFS